MQPRSFMMGAFYGVPTMAMNAEETPELSKNQKQIENPAWIRDESCIAKTLR